MLCLRLVLRNVLMLCLVVVCIGLCGVFLGVVASFLLFACVGVECCVGVAVWFRTCALAPAPACGFAAHTEVGPGFDSTSPAKSI